MNREARPAPGAERTVHIADLHTTVVGAADAPLAVVLLHGYNMQPADLSPFAHSLGVPALFLMPQGPELCPTGGHAWWDIDGVARERALLAGPRDLVDQYPAGLAAARQHLSRFLGAIAVDFQPRRMVIGGFSQGGMLALDWLLRGSAHADGLVLLSASRLALGDWQPRCARLQGLPVFVSHGETDRDLSFGAGERLRDFVMDGGAQVTWVPFGGGHEIPLVVWRGLRKFLITLLK